MVDNKATWKFKADPNRQATDPLRGYVYQAWQALHAWLELKDKQVMYLEGAEDFDIIDSESGNPVQVKDSSGRITLRSTSVTDAIVNFWSLCQKHPYISITFTFLTRSSIGTEKGSPFGKGSKGLALWQECRGKEETVKNIAEFLSKDSKVAQRLPGDLIEFLKNEESPEIYNNFISRVKWFTEAPPVEAVTDAINHKLITHGDKYYVPPSESKKTADRLLREVLTVASRNEYEDRVVDFATFAIIFEEVTSIRIPRKELQSLRAIQGISTQLFPCIPAGGPVSFQPLLHVLSPGLPPPLPPYVAERHELLESCLTILNKYGLLCITASTGMGKTTLAKFIARTQGGDWTWFTFTPFHGERFTWALAQASQMIDDLPHNSYLVLDDLPFDPGLVNEWEQAFAGLIYTTKERGTSVITTSRKIVPSRVRNLLGSLVPSELSVPGFDVNEIEKLCFQLGCPAEYASSQAKIAYFHTSGHPQLVHARLITLSRQNWPKATVDSFLKTPEDVREQKQQARQLLDSLDSDEVDLLYRASVALSPFLRESIILLGEKAHLPRPGDLFDRLVGPWIEKTAGDRFELSPLLKNSGTEVWSKSTINDIHSQLADSIIQTSNGLSIMDASHTLFHAFLGKNKKVLTGLCTSLITEASEEIHKALGESAFWFLKVSVENHKSPLFEGDQHLNFILRMTQFKLCVAADPDNAHLVLDAWGRELTQLDQSPENLLIRMLFDVHALLYVQAPISMYRVIELFRDFDDIRQTIIRSGDKELLEALPCRQIDMDGKSVDSIPTLFGLNAMRCRNKQDLDELLQGIKGLSRDLRQELLEVFDMPDGYASVYIDRVYLNEFKAEEPDWNSCLEVFSKTMDCATEWESPYLGASAARASAIILDENLDRTNDALGLLDEGVVRFPSHYWIMEEQRGTIYLRNERYNEAVEVFTRALKDREDCQLRSLNAPYFSFRNAGIAASHISRWDLAAEFFHRGHLCAEVLNDSIFSAAFQTDAAFSFWKAKCNQEMLESFRNSVALVDSMERSKADLGQFWVYRITSHILSWILRDVKDEQHPPELAKPYAGMCSNPERNKEILTLPDVPFELTLFFLLELEKELKSEPQSLDLYGARLDAITHPAISLFMTPLRIEQAFSTGSLGNLPNLIDKFIRAYVASRNLGATGKKIYNETEPEISDDQVKQTLVNEDFLVTPFLAALLRSFSNRHPDIYLEYIKEWSSSGANLSWSDELMKYLDNIKSIGRLPIRELLIILHGNESSLIDKYLAALFLVQKPTLIGLQDLLQVHVYLLDLFINNKFWGQYIEKKLSTVIASAWSQKAQLRFAMRMPNITVPKLEAVCSMKPDCFGKSAGVLLEAANAIGITIPQELADRYRQLRDS